LIWSPSNENLIATACEDKTFDIWDIFEEYSKVQVSVPDIVIMMQLSKCNPNWILLLVKSGEVHLLDLQMRKMKCVADFSKHSPSILRWHPKNVTAH
jgi:WD40 repeat protein